MFCVAFLSLFCLALPQNEPQLMKEQRIREVERKKANYQWTIISTYPLTFRGEYDDLLVRFLFFSFFEVL
jgi:hypothetical protein